MFAPHLSPDDNLFSRVSRSGVRAMLQQSAQLLQAGVDWSPSGVLEHRFDSRRLPELGPGPRRTGSSRSTKTRPPVWHAAAAWMAPGGAWCKHGWPNRASAGMATPGSSASKATRGNGGRSMPPGACWRKPTLPAPAAALETAETAAVDRVARSARPIRLHPVRGQLSWSLQDDDGPPLAAHPHNGKGHFLPDVALPEGRAWLSGSTYIRADRSLEVRPQEHLANLERLRSLVPEAAERLAPQFEAQRVRAWSGVRCASGDRRPLVGEIEPGLWLCTALGSRGLTFAALCAELLAARLQGEPLPLPPRLAAALDVARPGASATRVPATP